jgi:hypothetical protein
MDRGLALHVRSQRCKLEIDPYDTLLVGEVSLLSLVIGADPRKLAAEPDVSISSEAIDSATRRSRQASAFTNFLRLRNSPICSNWNALRNEQTATPAM